MIGGTWIRMRHSELMKASNDLELAWNCSMLKQIVDDRLMVDRNDPLQADDL